MKRSWVRAEWTLYTRNYALWGIAHCHLLGEMVMKPAKAVSETHWKYYEHQELKEIQEFSLLSQWIKFIIVLLSQQGT